MKISTSAALGVIAGALCLISLASVAAPLLGDNWQSDIQFPTSEFDASCVCDASCGSIVSDGCGYPCDGCCNSCGCCATGECDYGYCCNSPLSDELSRRMTAMAKSMQARGFVYAPGLTQFYQGVTEGGAEREFEYGGKVDQFLILDGTKLGIWPGMTMTMHAETRFGQDVNFEAVGFAPANVAMLYPKFDEHDTAITGLTFAQALDPDIQLTFGKFNALDLFYSLYPQTGRGVNGFMNASMVIPISVARVAPLSFLGAGGPCFLNPQ